MNAPVDDMERLSQRHFQIVIRLQKVRAQVQDLRRASMLREIAANEELLAAIQGLASAARQGGLVGLTLVANVLGERVESLARRGRIPDGVLALVTDWSARAELYVRRPRFAEFARSLVRQLQDPAWELPLAPAEGDRLISALLDPCL